MIWGKLMKFDLLFQGCVFEWVCIWALSYLQCDKTIMSQCPNIVSFPFILLALRPFTMFHDNHQTGVVDVYKKLYLLGVYWLEETENPIQIVLSNENIIFIIITIITIYLTENKTKGKLLLWFNLIYCCHQESRFYSSSLYSVILNVSNICPSLFIHPLVTKWPVGYHFPRQWSLEKKRFDFFFCFFLKNKARYLQRPQGKFSHLIGHSWSSCPILKQSQIRELWLW